MCKSEICYKTVCVFVLGGGGGGSGAIQSVYFCIFHSFVTDRQPEMTSTTSSEDTLKFGWSDGRIFALAAQIDPQYYCQRDSSL